MILIEQLAPENEFYDSRVNLIFDQAVLDVEKIAQEQTDENSLVIPVNMFEGFEIVISQMIYITILKVQNLSPNDITKS